MRSLFVPLAPNRLDHDPEAPSGVRSPVPEGL